VSNAARLLRGSFFRNADLCIGLGVAFLITPFIVSSLGNRMYGVWTLVGVFVGYYGLMDFGLASAASRYLSQSLGKGDLDELNETASTTLFLFSLIGLLVMLIAVICAWACPYFTADPADGVMFRRLMLLIGAGTAIGFPMRVYSGVLTSYIRFDLLAYISIARAILSNAVIYYALSRGGGIMTAALVSVVSGVLANTACWAVCRIWCPQVKITLFRYDPKKVRLMFVYGGKTFACQFGDILRFRLDSAVIAGFLNVGLLTPYSIGVRLVDGFSQLVLNSAGMMVPVFSQYEGRGDYDAIRSALLKVTRFSSLLSAFVGFSVIFYGHAFIRRWMGPGFDSSAVVAAILTVGFILQLPQSPGIQLLYALSKHEYYAWLNACEGLLNLALSLFFLKHYGMYGVALGTTVEMIIFKLLVNPFFICRVIRLPVRQYLLDVILGTLVKSAVPLGIYFYLIRDLVLPEYGRLAACVAAQTLVFAPAAYFFIISKSERQFLSRVLGLDDAFAALGLQRPPA
jgi:O-antigen/teichoic acid export membrane protein